MNKIDISICTYQDGLFQVMLRDHETRKEITLEGNRALTAKESELLSKLAPACVWTPYVGVVNHEE